MVFPIHCKMDFCDRMRSDWQLGDGVTGIWTPSVPPSPRLLWRIRLGLSQLRGLFQFLRNELVVLLPIPFVRLCASILLGQLLRTDLLCSRLLPACLLRPSLCSVFTLGRRYFQRWLSDCKQQRLKQFNGWFVRCYKPSEQSAFSNSNSSIPNENATRFDASSDDGFA